MNLNFVLENTNCSNCMHSTPPCFAELSQFVWTYKLQQHFEWSFWLCPWKVQEMLCAGVHIATHCKWRRRKAVDFLRRCCLLDGSAIICTSWSCCRHCCESAIFITDCLHIDACDVLSRKTSHLPLHWRWAFWFSQAAHLLPQHTLPWHCASWFFWRRMLLLPLPQEPQEIWNWGLHTDWLPGCICGGSRRNWLWESLQHVWRQTKCHPTTTKSCNAKPPQQLSHHDDWEQIHKFWSLLVQSVCTVSWKKGGASCIHCEIQRDRLCWFWRHSHSTPASCNSVDLTVAVTHEQQQQGAIVLLLLPWNHPQKLCPVHQQKQQEQERPGQQQKNLCCPKGSWCLGLTCKGWVWNLKHQRLLKCQFSGTSNQQMTPALGEARVGELSFGARVVGEWGLESRASEEATATARKKDHSTKKVKKSKIE